jgi:hypothetical protein
VDINASDTSTPTRNQISGLITQARAHQLNNQVSSFLASYSSYLDSGNMCSILLLRNDRQEKPELHSRRRHSAFRIAAACDGRTTTYGLRFRRANTFWKAPGVYFHMHQTSSPYHVRAGHNHYFGTETFFCQRCCDTLFWPIGSCLMLSPIKMRPRVGARPSLPEVVLPHL